MPIITIKKQPRLPELGRIFKGSPKQVKKRNDGTEYETFGEDLKGQFRVALNPQFEGLAPALANLFGNPIEIFAGINLIGGATAHEVFPHFLEIWKGKTLMEQSDGETIIRQRDENLNWDVTPRPHIEKKDGKGNSLWKPRARLRFSIPVLTEYTGIDGLFSWSCTSIYEIADIYQTLVYYEQRYGLPLNSPSMLFDMGREERMINQGDSGKQVEKSLVKLILNPTTTKALIRAEQEHLQSAILQSVQHPQLQAPVPDDTDYDAGEPADDEVWDTENGEQPIEESDRGIIGTEIVPRVIEILKHHKKGYYGVLHFDEDMGEPVFMQKEHIPPRFEPLKADSQYAWGEPDEKVRLERTTDTHKLIGVPLA